MVAAVEGQQNNTIHAQYGMYTNVQSCIQFKLSLRDMKTCVCFVIKSVVGAYDKELPNGVSARSAHSS